MLINVCVTYEFAPLLMERSHSGIESIELCAPQRTCLPPPLQFKLAVCDNCPMCYQDLQKMCVSYHTSINRNTILWGKEICIHCFHFSKEQQGVWYLRVISNEGHAILAIAPSLEMHQCKLKTSVVCSWCDAQCGSTLAEIVQHHSEDYIRLNASVLFSEVNLLVFSSSQCTILFSVYTCLGIQRALLQVSVAI